MSNKGKVTTDARVEDQHIDSCLSDLHRILESRCAVVSCYKPCQEATGSAAGSTATKATCLESVLRVLGLDSKKISEVDTLSDLGVDSLQVVTIKSILKGRGRDVNVADIYQLKVSDLKAMD